MRDLVPEDVIAVHARITAAGGGDPRSLSEANLHQMLFLANRIPACVPRAALVFYSLCAYPVFREGNPDTALGVAELVLGSGGYEITGDTVSALALAEQVIAFAAEPGDVECWFGSNTRQIPGSG